MNQLLRTACTSSCVLKSAALLASSILCFWGCTRDATDASEGGTGTGDTSPVTGGNPGTGTDGPESPDFSKEKKKDEGTPEKSKGGESDADGEPDGGDGSKKNTGSSNEKSNTDSTSKDDPESEEQADCDDGHQANCSERPDGTEIQFPTGAPLGSCAYGQKTCVNGKWGKCEDAIAPKEKDSCEAGNDDSCNGVPNEGCDCSPKETRPCGSNVGACKKGVQICGDDGKWGSECVGEIAKKKEVCDGQEDDDCDGLADRDDVMDCECVDGDPRRECSLSGMGDCGLGAKGCRGGKWERCVARFAQNAEVCGKRRDSFGEASGDEDCDGAVDEHFGGRPQGCETYIVDDDLDGFGAKGYSANSSTSSPLTYGCFCKKPSGSNWRRATGASSINSDCGDCDRNVKPTQRDFFGEPSYCLKGLGLDPFDYNCAGGAEKERSQTMRCIHQGDRCLESGFWSGEAPACGEAGRAGICTEKPTDDGECKVFSAEEVTIQHCR